MNPDAGIGRARTARHKAHTRPAGHRPVGTGHEGGAAFLTADHGLDLGAVVQRIEHRQKALARNGEDTITTLRNEAIDEQAAAGHADLFSHFAILAPGPTTGNARNRIIICHKNVLNWE